MCLRQKLVYRLRRACRVVVCAALCAVLGACSGEVVDTYSGYPAFFRFQPVTQVPQLFTALGNPGEYCVITFAGADYVFTSPTTGQTMRVTPTALEAYGQPRYIAGFIVGTPELPDVNGAFLPVAYDLACRACYDDSTIERAVAFTSRTEVRCGRCGRTYGLNSGGNVTSSQGGKPLFRYRVQYSPATQSLLISN